MPMIQFTERGAARQGRRSIRALAQAAVAAGRAPSILNTQPWRWRIADDVAELRADRERQLAALDPDGRLLTISCGAALHHARTALAGARHVADVTRLPDADDPDLLARVRVVGETVSDPAAVRLQLAMALRRTDRRPFAEVEVPPEALDRLRVAAQREGAHLHLLCPDDVVTLAAAAAAAARASDAFVDRYARYGVLFADSDTPAGWLAAGEALSAVLLTATAEQLAVSPTTDVVEVPATRVLLRSLLGGIGHPMVALRLGIPDSGAAAATGRRATGDVVDVSGPPAGGSI